ncbi:MAG: translocation/assembly module TamB domain-containing protein, partial [Sedimenticolaceae bacterium]
RSELDGELHIPYGRIRPKELPKSAITGTSDLVVVGRDAPQQEEPADSNFHSRLRIIFGDRVSFQGFGLRANLTGNLLVIDEPGRPVIGRGRLGVTDGTYRAYGQDLKIERGYVLFADSPVDNPGVDVRAVREVGEVTAGLRVSGTLKAPKLALFSTPAMSQSEVASYLLTGRPPGKSGSNVDVATALQAAGIGNLTSEAARQLGLEELRVETGNSLAEASVVAGTYLSPRLYVQYVNELASRETKLRLRYDLNDRLQIQTESGRSQGVDLFYTIER